MSNNLVTVLTPNGRRPVVKVQPNKTILQILEEVCQKYNFQAKDYDLKHHKRILDLSQTFRFSGLPNNAQIEMIEIVRQRSTDDSDVILMVQLEDGTRVPGTFKSSTTLMEILQKICPDSVNEENLIVVYMRTEITSNLLTSTTLKSLGLTSGRAIIRVMKRNPDALGMQANVSAPLKAKPISSENELVDKKTETIVTLNTINESQNQETESTLSKANVQENETENLMDVDENEDSSAKSLSPVDRKKIKIDSKSNENNKIPDERTILSDQAAATVQQTESEPEIVVLGDRNAVLFSLETAQRASFDDIHDSFFELTVNDVQTLLRDLRAQARNLDDAPLLTAKMREMQNCNQQLINMGKYKKTVIRIQFAVDRLILQGTFSPVDTIETVMNFIRPYINNGDDKDFHLYTTPPKQILAKDQRLIEIHCVPTALLHFGVSDTNVKGKFLKDEYANRLSSPSAALLAASKSRAMNSIENDSSETISDTNIDDGASGVTYKGTIVGGNFKASSVATTSNASTHGEKGIPKWFKPSGK